MLRPVRTLVMLLVAFVAGLLYERNLQTDRCLDRGGHMSQGLCEGTQ